MSLLKNFKHSASSANKFVNVPQLFVADKIMGIKQPYGDAAIRGNVAEPLARYLMAKDVTGEQALDFATKKWEKLGGQDKTELRFAYDCAYLIAEELQSRQLKRPEKYQERVFNDGKEFGLKYGIHGFLDFSYFKNVPMPLVIDIKTTKRVPSSLDTVSKDHIYQQSLYFKLTQIAGIKRKFALLYVSNKKTNYLEIPESYLEEGWKIIYHNMKLIERVDDMCKSKADWLLSFPYPDLSSFYFSDKKFKEQITKLYEGVLNNG
jgi:hypothetical protein